MPRRKCMRYVSGDPEAMFYLPEGRRPRELARVVLMPDELEALRLADQLGLYQEEAAARMRVSRPTFSRIVASARAKVADALVNGKAILLVPLPNAPDVSEDTMSHPEPLDTPAVDTNAPVAEANAGIVCIPIAIDHGLDSKLLNHFGSAPLFAIVDVAARTMTTLDNSAAHGHGGCAPVEAIVAQHVEAVIVGGIGGGAIRRLGSYGIPVYQGRPGPISALVDDYAKGLLATWDPADGCAAHGSGHGHGRGHGNAHEHAHGHGIGRGQDISPEQSIGRGEGRGIGRQRTPD